HPDLHSFPTRRSSDLSNSAQSSGLIRNKKGFRTAMRQNSGVERTRVDHRMHFGLAAENDHQIADHGSAALIVQVHNLLLGQFFRSEEHTSELQSRSDL